jgi:predicted metalloprotease
VSPIKGNGDKGVLLTIIPRLVIASPPGTVLLQEDALSNQQPYGGQQPPYQGPPQQWGAPQYPPAPQQYSGGQQYPPPGPPGPQYGGMPQYGGQQFAGPPPGGPGFGWGPGGPQQPKKKRKGWLVLIPVVLVAVVGLWIYGVINKQHRLDSYADPEPTSGYSPTADPTDEPSDEPTKADPTQPKPTKTSAAPPRRATPYEIVSRNKFYRTGIQPGIGCRESGARATSIANANKYYAVVKSCADRGWPRQVRAGGWTFEVPRTIVMSAHVQSPCGGDAPTSYYCSTNRTIYMAGFADTQRYPQYRGAQNQALLRAGMAFTVAHEYGHHVQELTGVLDASDSLGYASGSTAGRLEESRRLELQASCLAGVFLAANRNTYPFKGLLKSGLDFWVSHSGDEADPTGERIHGTMKNHNYWFHRGYNSRNIAACNTYVAPSSLVS